MKILILTQKIDKNDPILGFFHGWLIEFAKHFEQLTVICLQKGEYTLPENITVLSLGKENTVSRFTYIIRFYAYVWQERKNYDAVFVHMNQEYILLGSLLWKLLGKKITLWRNHHAGNILTNIAVFLCDKVFCTSKYSYTAKFVNTILMPVGINTDIFQKDTGVAKTPNSILFLARIAFVKKPHILVEALKLLKQKNILFTATIYGDPLPKDHEYEESLKKIVEESGLLSSVFFHKGIPNTETVRVYNSHEIFVNLSSSGMYDKTIFEAMACESLTLASNKNLVDIVDQKFIFEENDANGLAQKLEHLLTLSLDEKIKQGNTLRKVVIEHHSLKGLAIKLASALS
ncbi:MAG: glycosyltransferase family 4 protein [Patescibacteria group bacterium]